MQVEDIDLSEREQALDLLKFLLCIEREVEVTEVAAYLFFHYAGQQDPLGQEASLQYIKELGGSFIRVTRKSKPQVTTFPGTFAPKAGTAFVQLAHSTVSQYLRNRFQLPDVNGTIANRCLKYLSSTVDAQKCFGSIKSRYGFGLGEDQMEGGVHPKGGLDGRRARDMFLAGWQACRYPCTTFLQASYPFALYAWSYWRRHLREAGVAQKEAAIISEKNWISAMSITLVRYFDVAILDTKGQLSACRGVRHYTAHVQPYPNLVGRHDYACVVIPRIDDCSSRS